jgi:catechol 2,3-dioxygenase-like lactoylglutathione lyase family enzyme
VVRTAAHTEKSAFQTRCPVDKVEELMAITLNHTIVPARDKEAAAREFAQLFGLPYAGSGEHFAPVKINDGLTFLFDEDRDFRSHHYAFHVSDAEFDAIFGRVQKAGLAHGSAPWSAEDGKLNHWGGGKGVYFRTADRHLLELMTVPQ